MTSAADRKGNNDRDIGEWYCIIVIDTLVGISGNIGQQDHDQDVIAVTMKQNYGKTQLNLPTDSLKNLSRCSPKKKTLTRK